MNGFGWIAPIHSAQPPYNLFERDIEYGVLPHCASEGIAVLAYGSICRGLLSGRMTADTRFESDDLRTRRPEQLDPVGDVMGWKLEGDAFREIDRIVRDTIKDPVGPEFMAPPARTQPIDQRRRIPGKPDASARA
jgi:hypothetical protein